MNNEHEHPEDFGPDELDSEILDSETLDSEILDPTEQFELDTDDEPIDSEPADGGVPSQPVSRRRVLQGLAGGAVVAGGLAVTANRATGPLVEAGGSSEAGLGSSTSTTPGGTAGGTNSAVQVVDGSSSTTGQSIVAGAEGTTNVGDPASSEGTAMAGDTTSPSVVDSPAATTPTTVDPPVSGQEVLRGADIGSAAPVEQRVLVIIELQGGSDGLSLVVPDDANYRSNRTGDLMISPADYHALDGGVGLHPSLSLISKSSSFNVATVEGVGPINGNLSHFKMAASWERGDVNSAKLVSSGFCGRVADAVNLSNGFAGVSVAGRTGFFEGGRVPALVMSEASELDVVTDVGEASFRKAAQSFTNPIGANWVKLDNMGVKLKNGLANPPDNTMIRRGKELGEQLYLAAQLIKADIGVKVLYANLGSFDTHDNQERRLRFLWEEFDYAVAGFFDMLNAAGMGNRALIATTSEFGRRLKQNARGTDHGSASNLIMIGPIQQRRYGAYPSLTSLDSDGNLKTEVPFDRYYATLCKDWMGVEPSLVLPGDPRPLGLA